MSSNRLKLLLVSVMAVFAIGAVASASSASAACYKVAVGGTGHWENSTCTVVGTTKEYVEVEQLETEIKPGEWCAKVKAGEPSTFEDNKCTKAKAGTGEFIKVLVPVFEECKESATGTLKGPLCEAGSSGKFEWVPITVAKPVTSAGKAFTLTAGGKEISCTEVTDTGTVGPGGKDTATSITFTGCKTKQAKCKVKSKGGTFGTIAVTNIPTKLEKRKNASSVEVVVDNFEQKEVEPGKFEFVTLEFEPETGGSCSEYPTTKVKGAVAAEAINLANGKVELNFPTTALEKDTLNAFGVASTLLGKDTQSLVSGAGSRVS